LISTTMCVKYVTFGSNYASREAEEHSMRLSAPKKTTWWVAVVIGVVGVVANLVTIPVISGFAFWLVVIGFVLLALGTYLKGF
jgi:hypothetical protein